MPENRVKAALKAGWAVTGPILHEVRSVGLIKLMAAAGHDFVFIDMEHGMYSMETVADLCQMSLAVGVCPLVRPPDLAYHLVARALDAGAQGVIIPRVQNLQEAETAVSYAKYPPIGRRGAGGDGRNAYERRGVLEAIDEGNSQTMVILQIESAEGLANVDEIASVDGVDVILIGPNDLSISMGISGEYETDAFRDAIAKIVAACQKHDVAIGTLGMSGEQMRPWYEMGFRFLLCNIDGNMIAEAAYRDVEAIRAFTG